MRPTILLFLWVSSFQFLPCKGQSPLKNLERDLESIYKKSNFPGFAISIINPDSTIFSRSYGFADKVKKLPYTLETIQPIASVSKTFIALALMKSIELGYFTLETDINDILPFKVINPKFPNENIKVKHLATHTSSLIDNKPAFYSQVYQIGRMPTIELGTYLKDYYTKDGKFYSLQNFDTLKVGSSYAYSNVASALMGYIIEYKSKMAFSEFCKKYIFEPLKMNNTDWFYNKNYDSKYATLYEINEPEFPLEEKILNDDKSLQPYCCIAYPDGSLKTSIADMTIYLRAMMKGYFTTDTLIIGRESYRSLFAKQFDETSMPLNMDKKEPNRAIFWAYSKKGSIRHTGSDPGVFSFISFNPITKMGLVMTMNASLDGGENHRTVGHFMKVIEALDNFETSLK